VFVVFGHLFLVVGIIGVVVPLLPTTPFILLACCCYERGSPKFHAIVLENKYIGTHVRNWKQNGSIPLRAKIVAVSMITLSIGYIVYAASLVLVKIVIGAIGVCVSAYILTRPSTLTQK
jgi:uncharacterized membrane protein YbaN (DUF454 family)